MTDAGRRLVPARMSAWTVFGIAVGVAGVLLAAWTANEAQRVLGWALVAVLLAALVWPLRNALDRHLPKVVATILSILMLIVAPVAFLLVSFRDLSDQFEHLRSRLVEASQNVEAAGRFSDPAQRFHLTDQVKRLLDALDPAGGGVSKATSLASALVVVTVLTIFLVADNGRIPRNFLRQIPDAERRLRVAAVVGLAYRRWRRYQLGMLGKAVVVGGLVWAVAMILDLPAATVVALVAAVSSIVPIVGTFAGMVPLIILAAGLHSPGAGIAVFLFALMLQVVDQLVVRQVIQPRSTVIGPVVPIVIALVVGQEFGLGAAVCSIALATFAMTTIEAIGTSRRLDTTSAAQAAL